MPMSAFILSCEPIVRAEVRRLMRRGARVPLDDGMQVGFLSLVEARATLEAATGEPRALARVIVRRRLIGEFVVRQMTASRRAVAMVEVDTGDDDDDHGLAAWRVAKVESHEAGAVLRLYVAAIVAEVGPMPLPRGTRQATHQAVQRWAARARRVA